MRHQRKQTISAFIASILMGGVGFSQQANADDAAELAKKLSNPIAALISVPIKIDWDTDIGAAEADRTSYTIQPVVPFDLDDDIVVISRTIVPFYVDAESPALGGVDSSGMGDIVQSFFFSPKAPTAGGWIWGAGPVMSLPTGDDDISSDKFSVGPTAVLLKQEAGWTYGALASQMWSVSGDDDKPDVSLMFLQPFLAYATKSHTTFSINTESSYNWDSEEWTVPINLSVSQLVMFGKQPVSFQLGYRNYVDSPNDVMDWGVRFQVTLLFPK
jgi:hypothetical protein